MSAKKAKPNARTPTDRRAYRVKVRRVTTKTFRDGSAVILDGHDGIIGLIEARPRYRCGDLRNPKGRYADR